MDIIHLLTSEGHFDENKPFVQKGRGKIKTMYYNEELNNLIIINIHRGSNVDEALGYIVGERFTYFSNVLRNQKNIVAEVYKIEGTTSDYVINYDLQPKWLINRNIHEVIKIVRANYPEKTLWCKTTEIRNGIAYVAGTDRKLGDNV